MSPRGHSGGRRVRRRRGASALAANAGTIERGVAGALEWPAAQQAALRRVAILVASGASQRDVLTAVAEAVARIARADTVQIFRYEEDAWGVRVAVAGKLAPVLAVGERYALGGHNVLTLVHETGREARVDDKRLASGPVSVVPLTHGVTSAVGNPVVVGGALWGVLASTTTSADLLPEGIERHIIGFTELVAIAIAHAQALEDLAASRRRIVTAADEMRRQIERNLHDGAQQGIVRLGLELRALRERLGSGDAVAPEIESLEQQVASLLDDVRDLATGVHPQILSHRGLEPALRALTRRSGIPVELQVEIPERLPVPLEVTAYYVVCEAVTNTLKHASATTVWIAACVSEDILRLSIVDDGVGGAGAARGSGLIGVQDRVAVHGGVLEIRSPSGAGTRITVELPVPRG